MSAVSDRTWKGQQSVNREVIEKWGERTLRFTIKVDSYDFQSYGKVEVWKDDAWSTVHKIPGQELKSFKKTSYVDRHVNIVAFKEDLDELRTVAMAVLR